MNQHYELTYIIPIKFLDDEMQKATQIINSLVKKFNGVISSEQNLGKQRLAYPIKQVHQGTYVSVEFDMDGANMLKMDAELRIMPEVLRHLIIKKKIKSAKEIQREEKIQAGLRRAKEEELSQIEEARRTSVKKAEDKLNIEAEAAKQAKAPQKKATLEELDKKLDELLTDDIL